MPFNKDSWYKVDDIKAQQEAQATVAGARSEASRAKAKANRIVAQAINPETSDFQLFLNNNL